MPTQLGTQWWYVSALVSIPSLADSPTPTKDLSIHLHRYPRSELVDYCAQQGRVATLSISSFARTTLGHT